MKRAPFIGAVVLGLLLSVGFADAAESYFAISIGGTPVYPGGSVTYSGLPVKWDFYMRTSAGCESVSYYLRVLVSGAGVRDSPMYQFMVCGTGWNQVAGGTDYLSPGTVEYFTGGDVLGYFGFYLVQPTPTPAPAPTQFPTPTPYYPTPTPYSSTPSPFFPTPTSYYPASMPSSGTCTGSDGSVVHVGQPWVSGNMVLLCDPSQYLVLTDCGANVPIKRADGSYSCEAPGGSVVVVGGGGGAPRPTPGFEAVFAVAGLLIVSYLVSRRGRRDG